WFATNTQFWYRNDLRDGAREFILVDAEKGRRRPAFDHARLAKALSTAAGKEFSADKLPFESIEFLQAGKSVRFEAAEKMWKCDLSSYECIETTAAPTEKSSSAAQSGVGFGVPALAGQRESFANADLEPAEAGTTNSLRRRSGERAQNRSDRSPNEKWTALIKEHNVWLRSESGEEFQLSKDGETNNAYGRLEWSPDSKALVAWRIVPGERKEVYLVQ